MALPRGTVPTTGPIVDTSGALPPASAALRDAGAVSLRGGRVRKVNAAGNAWEDAVEGASAAAINAALDALIDNSSRDVAAPAPWAFAFAADPGAVGSREADDPDFLDVALTADEEASRQAGEVFRIRVEVELDFEGGAFQPRVTLGGRVVPLYVSGYELEFPVAAARTLIPAAATFRGFQGSGTLTVTALQVLGVGTHEAEFDAFVDGRIRLSLDPESAARASGDRALSDRIDSARAAGENNRNDLDSLDADVTAAEGEIGTLQSRVGDLETGRQGSQGVLDHLSLADTGALADTPLVAAIAPVVIAKAAGAPVAGDHVVAWDLRQRPAQTVTLVTDLLEYRPNGELWENVPIPAVPAHNETQRTYLTRNGQRTLRFDNLTAVHLEQLNDRAPADGAVNYRIRWVVNGNVVRDRSAAAMFPPAAGLLAAEAWAVAGGQAGEQIRVDLQRNARGELEVHVWPTRPESPQAVALARGYVLVEAWQESQVQVPAVPASRRTLRIGALSGWLLAWLPTPGDVAADQTRLRSGAGHNRIARPFATSTVPAIAQRKFLGAVAGGSVSFDVLDQLWPYVQDAELGLRRSAGRSLVADVPIESPGAVYVYDATRHGRAAVNGVRGYRSGDVVIVSANVTLADLAGGRIAGVRYVRDVDFAAPPLPFRLYKADTAYAAGDIVILPIGTRASADGFVRTPGVTYLEAQ